MKPHLRNSHRYHKPDSVYDKKKRAARCHERWGLTLATHPPNSKMCTFQGARGCSVNDNGRFGFIEEFVRRTHYVRKPGVPKGGPIKRENFRKIRKTITQVKKRVRVACPVCGRKLWAWKSFHHDGDYVSYEVPAHKKKGWWKKPKAKKKEKRCLK